MVDATRCWFKRRYAFFGSMSLNRLVDSQNVYSVLGTQWAPPIDPAKRLWAFLKIFKMGATSPQRSPNFEVPRFTEMP